MQLHVLTNCSISLVLLKNLTVHLSANKMMITEVRATMMMMMTARTTMAMNTACEQYRLRSPIFFFLSDKTGTGGITRFVFTKLFFILCTELNANKQRCVLSGFKYSKPNMKFATIKFICSLTKISNIESLKCSQVC